MQRQERKAFEEKSNGKAEMVELKLQKAGPCGWTKVEQWKDGRC